MVHEGREDRDGKKGGGWKRKRERDGRRTAEGKGERGVWEKEEAPEGGE